MYRNTRQTGGEYRRVLKRAAAEHDRVVLREDGDEIVAADAESYEAVARRVRTVLDHLTRLTHDEYCRNSLDCTKQDLSVATAQRDG